MFASHPIIVQDHFLLKKNETVFSDPSCTLSQMIASNCNFPHMIFQHFSKANHHEHMSLCKHFSCTQYKWHNSTLMQLSHLSACVLIKRIKRESLCILDKYSGERACKEQQVHPLQIFGPVRAATNETIWVSSQLFRRDQSAGLTPLARITSQLSPDVKGLCFFCCRYTQPRRKEEKTHMQRWEYTPWRQYHNTR